MLGEGGKPATETENSKILANLKLLQLTVDHGVQFTPQ